MKRSPRSKIQNKKKSRKIYNITNWFYRQTLKLFKTSTSIILSILLHKVSIVLLNHIILLLNHLN